MWHQYVALIKKNSNYRWLWLGYVVSQIGDWFNLLASATLVANLTSTGVALSYLFLARFVPQFLFSPFAGVLADRYDRRWVMIMADVLRAGTVLGFLLVREPTQIWLFYVLTVVQFLLSALFIPARTAVLASIVSRQELVTANALDSLTWSSMLAIGSLLGGIATAVLGLEAAFLLDALTFLLSGWLIWRIDLTRSSGAVQSSHQAKRRGQEFWEGMRYLWHKPRIFGIACVKAGGALVWGAINVLEVNFAEQLFPLDIFDSVAGDVLTLTLIYTLSGLGTGLGPVVLRHFLGDSIERLLWGISIGFILLCVSIFGLSIASTLGVFLFWTTVRTVGSGSIWVFSAALLQMVIPNGVRGRVFAFEFALMTLAQSISIYWAGASQDNLKLSIGEATMSMAICGVAVTAVWLYFHGIAQRKSGAWHDAA